jgi:predicted DNA-binding transcriptional regulator AlpA
MTGGTQMLTANRHGRRRVETLQRRGFTEAEIGAAPDPESSGPSLSVRRRETAAELDPLLSAKQVCEFLGRISQMTLWRYCRNLGFPPPDFLLSRRRFWRASSVEAWLATQADRAA